MAHLRLWTVAHVLFSVAYVAAGAAQLIAGVFLFVTAPELHLGGNVCSGALNVMIGIAVGMVACFAAATPRRQESLLYVSVATIVINAVNAALTEWCLYVADLPTFLLSRKSGHATLISHACVAVRVAIGFVLVASFLDSQLGFCSLQVAKKRWRDDVRRRSIERASSDIEYIIPRAKSSKPSSIYQAYTQSWVFEGGGEAAAAPAASPPPKNAERPKPPPEPEAADLRTFVLDDRPPPPIYEHLERLTEPSLYRSRLDTALSARSGDGAGGGGEQFPPPLQARRADADNVQYASLMRELERAIGKAESPGGGGGGDGDAEFTKELEAALKLIQDLESPVGKEAAPAASADSQSTSGYSSPNMLENKGWSADDLPRGGGAGAGGDFFAAVPATLPRGRSRVGAAAPAAPLRRRSSSSGGAAAGGSLWNVRSLLRRSKTHHRPPRESLRSAELDGAIIKSESLAYLTDLELLARHERHKNLERRIERRVLERMESMSAKDTVAVN